MNDFIQKTLERSFVQHGIDCPTDLSIKSTDPVRIGALIDRAIQDKNTLEKRYQWADFNFYPGDYILYKNDDAIRLTEKETALLETLLKAKGEAVHRDMLLKDIWRYAPDVETHTLETHIYRLRQKIEDDPAQPTIIVTEGEGDGYRLQEI